MTTPITPPDPADKEELYFEGSPSLCSAMGPFLLCFLLSGILIAGSIIAAIHHYPLALIALPIGIALLFIPRLILRSTRYRISNYRIDYERGLFAKDIDTIELWHIEDIRFHQSFFNRLCNIGNITVLSHDDTTPQLNLHGLPNPRPLYESLKNRVIAVKRQRGVIKVDPGN